MYLICSKLGEFALEEDEMIISETQSNVLKFLRKRNAEKHIEKEEEEVGRYS